MERLSKDYPGAFYHVGAKETNRNPVIEALLTNYTVTGKQNTLLKENEQLSIFNMATV